MIFIDRYMSELDVNVIRNKKIKKLRVFLGYNFNILWTSFDVRIHWTRFLKFMNLKIRKWWS